MATELVVAGMTESNVVVHPEPTWRDRSDFVISADLPEEGRSEQLWVRQLDDYWFEVCCIPFFLYGVALGDIVETDESYDMTKVIKGSGHAVFRAWFGCSAYPRQHISDELLTFGAAIEWSSVNLLAVDAADVGMADSILAFLTDHQNHGNLMVETGKSA